MAKKTLSLFLLFALLLSLLCPALAADTEALAAADTLHSLGLFNGLGDDENGRPDYALDAALTRQEGLVLLVRLLGREKAAESGGWQSHPFTDVDSWADTCFNYAWSKGLVNGVSATEFNAGGIMTATEFLTLVLRALGYADGADFSWDRAWALSDAIGLTSGEYGAGTVAFLRGDAALVCRAALGVNLRATTETLLSSFVRAGVISQSAVAQAGLGQLLSPGPMNARQMYEYAAPAVLLLETYASPTADPYSILGTGSGFFVTSDGVGVTNYHVLEKSKSAVVTLFDGTRHRIESILYANALQDICVFRVAKSSVTGAVARSFPCLEMAAHNTVYTGDEIYTVGCPLGLSSTISDGIVGSRYRIVAGVTEPFIQISAPISKGSSGGALLNVYGQVIGITSATYTDSQNMNLAIPLDRVIAMDLTAAGSTYSSMIF